MTGCALSHLVTHPRSYQDSQGHRMESHVHPKLCASNSTSFTVWTSSMTFRLCWFGFLALHAACAAHYAGAVLVYKELASSTFGNTLEVAGIGLGKQHDPLISRIMICFAALHTLAVLSMVVYSVVFQQFTFSIPAKNVPAALRYLSSKVITASDGTESTHCIVRVFHRVFGRKGFFGIEGKHFVTLFLLQEVVQTMLRASQASKLATFVPRGSVVRAYVALIVIQCLSIPVFRRTRQTSPGLERLPYIMSDVLLGFVTAIVIPTVLALPYAQQYGMHSRNFPIPLYEDSEWYASMLSEFQRILIGSGFDLFTRIIMSMSILVSLDDSKVLLCPISSCKDIKHVVRAENSDSQSENTSGTVVVPRRKRYAHRIMKILIAGVGTAIMVFHVRTEVLGHHDGCILPVRPWTSSKPGCAFMLLNCEIMKIQGSKALKWK